jgi:5-methylcytosine-specific restriction enzyme A
MGVSLNLPEDIGLAGVDEDIIRLEKNKARSLRKSRWWKNKIARGTCYYCGNNVPSSKLTMDHIVPLARGGKSSKNNLVACCKDCNTKKKTMLPMEWDSYMEN